MDYFEMILASVVIYLNIVLFTTLNRVNTIDSLLKQSLLVICAGNILFALVCFIDHAKLQIVGVWMQQPCWLEVSPG